MTVYNFAMTPFDGKVMSKYTIYFKFSPNFGFIAKFVLLDHFTFLFWPYPFPSASALKSFAQVIPLRK